MKKIIYVIITVALLGCMHMIFSKKKLADPQAYANLAGHELGETVFKDLGCASCHSVDGSAKNGGTLKGIFGAEATFVDGKKLKRDINYLKESILTPNVKIVKDRKGTMPSFQDRFEGRDKELQALLSYLQGLSK